MHIMPPPENPMAKSRPVAPAAEVEPATAELIRLREENDALRTQLATELEKYTADASDLREQVKALKGQLESRAR
jgi:hypothetical protein